MPDVFSSATAGLQFRGFQRGAAAGAGTDQYVIPVEDKVVSFRGRAATFVTPGRGGVTQRLFALMNAGGSPVIVSLNRIVVDLLTTAVKAQNVLPPIIRANRITATSGGTALTKMAMDSNMSSNGSVSVAGDSSADNGGAGTLSGTALSVTTTGQPLAQIYAPRVLTAVGYELVDTAPFFIGEPDVILRAGEGMAISLDQATSSTGNPSTDRWTLFADWTEFTRP